MSSYDATSIIAEAIRSEVRQPLGSPRFLIESDEQVARSIIGALEDAGFEIVKRGEQPSI